MAARNMVRRSVVIPVYRNEANIPALLAALEKLLDSFEVGTEVVFVVDGSPDRSHELLQARLPAFPHPTQLIRHSRNFGSFQAVRTGMAAARGDLMAAVAADLQEPTELVARFFTLLDQDQADVTFGVRERRDDPWVSRLLARAFWALYRYFVNPDMPSGGVDCFGCNRTVAEALLSIQESNSSLVAQLFWLGFRRQFVGYVRQRRQAGKSAWTFGKRLRYMLDSIISFTDLPIMVIIWVGFLTFCGAAIYTVFLLRAWLAHQITVPGYTATILVVILLGSLILFTQGLIGLYVWRAFENTKRRPLSLVSGHETFEAAKRRTRS
ncbi:MAG TPA: glycosyltransferase family 2 protein [Gammaproteobacteria bacterium]|nr:glycosyltransferase family 2 protein [Gammaproteobacteria bacterium]